MSLRLFQYVAGLIALIFTVFFAVYLMPPAVASGDILGAFGAGFVNPFSTGYAVDAILCWVLLLVWIVYERASLQVRHGWVCVVLGLVPGVAVGFGLYLILRTRQIGAAETATTIKSAD